MPSLVRRVFVVFVFLIVLVSIARLNVGYSFYHTIETGEHLWKTGFAHQLFNSLAKHTSIKHHEWSPMAIIFVHVPRTGGDSLQTHLFPTSPDDGYTRSQWWGNDTETRFYDDLHKMGDLNFNSPARKKVYKGFISRDDVIRLREGPWKEQFAKKQVKLFTILRHPHERVISTMKWLNKNHVGCGSCPPSMAWEFEAYPASKFNPPYTKNTLITNINNSIAHQLGGRREAKHRGKVISDIVVQNAKDFLKDMDFVGFYEDLVEDYEALQEKIFNDFESKRAGLEDSTWLRALRLLRKEFFEWGTVISRLRMRTLKYSTYIDTQGQSGKSVGWGVIRRNLTL
jgi:hypothetical protein